jgi:hypothetical protein
MCLWLWQFLIHSHLCHILERLELHYEKKIEANSKKKKKSKGKEQIIAGKKRPEIFFFKKKRYCGGFKLPLKFQNLNATTTVQNRREAVCDGLCGS